MGSPAEGPSGETMESETPKMKKKPQTKKNEKNKKKKHTHTSHNRPANHEPGGHYYYSNIEPGVHCLNHHNGGAGRLPVSTRPDTAGHGWTRPDTAGHGRTRWVTAARTGLSHGMFIEQSLDNFLFFFLKITRKKYLENKNCSTT